MTHHGKAALHRLALRRTEKVGDTGVTLGSILDYVASLEAEIDRMRERAERAEAKAAKQDRDPFNIVADWHDKQARAFKEMSTDIRSGQLGLAAGVGDRYAQIRQRGRLAPSRHQCSSCRSHQITGQRSMTISWPAAKCCTGDDEYCVCADMERALRGWIRGELPAMTDAQRTACLAEIGGFEGYTAEDHAGDTDAALARTVLSAWTDYCRDKDLM